MYCSIHSFALYICGSAPHWLIYHTVSQLEWIFSSSLPCHDNDIPLHKELKNEHDITASLSLSASFHCQSQDAPSKLYPETAAVVKQGNMKRPIQALGVTQSHLADCNHTGTILHNTASFWFCFAFFFFCPMDCHHTVLSVCSCC